MEITIDQYNYFIKKKIDYLEKRINQIESILKNIHKEYQEELEKYKKSFWLKRKFTQEPFINNFLVVSYESEKDEHLKNNKEAKDLLVSLSEMTEINKIKLTKDEIEKYEIEFEV